MSIEIPTDTIIDKVFACFKKITPALAAVSLVTGAVLFLPKNILALLGLSELSNGARITIGIFFLLSATLIITIVLAECWQVVKAKVSSKRMLRKLRRSFLALAPDQKRIVLELLKSDDKTILLDMASGNARYLQENLFIYRPDQMIEFGYIDALYVKFIPHPWLIDLYNKEPEIFF